MTIPVQVTPYNLEDLKQMVLNGPVRTTLTAPCGANYVIRPDKRRLRLAEGNLENVAEQT